MRHNVATHGAARLAMDATNRQASGYHVMSQKAVAMSKNLKHSGISGGGIMTQPEICIQDLAHNGSSKNILQNRPSSR